MTPPRLGFLRASPDMRLRLLLRIGVTGAFLTVVARSVDPGRVVTHLSGLSPVWLAAAGMISVAQVVGSAWRWRYTAGRLGVDLSLGRAVREYYLATFLNQVLPGGVVGDVSRAWRHEGRTGTHAVILERASGQMVMILLALSAAGVLLPPTGLSTLAWSSGTLVVGFGLWTVGGRPATERPGRAEPTGLVEGFRRDARRALLAPDVLPIQLATSLLVVASYVGVFLVAARAIGVSTPLGTLAPLVPLVLLAMLLPVSLAGWGIREGAAAALWASVGLAPAEGVAVSVAYGLLVLVTSLPGAWVLLRDVAGPGRRGRRGPEGSDDTPDGAPRRGRPPAAA